MGATIAKHPIHPMLVVFPIGLWIFSLVCDLVYLFGPANPLWRSHGVLHHGGRLDRRTGRGGARLNRLFQHEPGRSQAHCYGPHDAQSRCRHALCHQSVDSLGRETEPAAGQWGYRCWRCC